MTVDELTKITQDDLRRIEASMPCRSSCCFPSWCSGASSRRCLPVVVGGLSIVTSLALLNVLTAVMDIDAFAINIVTGLGLGLAIDYSLFLVTRFREELEGSRFDRGGAGRDDGVDRADDRVQRRRPWPSR